jgi:hypothetical protein
MPVTLPHASGESYVATKPPPVRTVSEGLQSNRPQATLPQTGNLALPSIESLKNAFRPKGGPSPDITSELLLVDVLDEPLSESAEMALDLLDEMEVEQTHPTSPTILCLRDEPPAALRSFARIVQTFSFQLQPANTTQHLLEMLEATQPQAIALSSSQCHTGTRLLQHLQDANGDKRLPLFEADEEEAQGLRIRLRWGPYISPYQKDTFWHAWLQKTKTKDEHRHALLLGLSVAEGKSLTNYFCETTHAKTANNPVDGIQYLYQQPPLLFVVKLEQEPLQWASLFTELAGLYNMKEVPVLVISEQPLPPELNAPLSSLNTLVLEHAS